MTRDIIRKSPILLFLMVFFSALLLQFLLPWWMVVVIGLAAGMISTLSPWRTFLIVFVAIGSLWLLASLYLTFTHSSVLLPRMAGLLQLPTEWMIYLVTVLVGALPASFAALGSSSLKPKRS